MQCSNPENNMVAINKMEITNLKQSAGERSNTTLTS